MFRKVLIANRGEIAVRVIRACRELGISPVAVYSEADRASLHVRLADEAYLLGPSPSTESYLAIEKILEAAKRCRAEAIHPGYGFLSENPHFARACAQAGIPMIGPSAASIEMMGNKIGARAALAADVPIIPGTPRALKSVEEAAVAARQIGYPVIIKAAAGGGGKGMRLVENESQLARDFVAAGSEAQRSFADLSVYMEKYIHRPRHVEIQILADKHGQAIYLGERECSIQRRHQKIVEECPSPILDEALRRRMGEAALRVVRAAKYENAGTVEFLLDQGGQFYFLEMNTRLQVEHPVTEIVTGLDIVQEQFRIAAGERLSLRQEDVQMRGWALECRIYAEDPEKNFLPSPGRIEILVEPQGPGVRVDSGVYEGWEVPIYYDPLVSKLITSGSGRAQAIMRMKRALAEYRVEGIGNNLRFFAQLLDDPDFEAGRLSTGFVEEFFQRRPRAGESSQAWLEAAAVGAALSYRQQGRSARNEQVASSQSAWKMATRPTDWSFGKNWRRSH